MSNENVYVFCIQLVCASGQCVCIPLGTHSGTYLAVGGCASPLTLVLRKIMDIVAADAEVMVLFSAKCCVGIYDLLEESLTSRMQ